MTDVQRFLLSTNSDNEKARSIAEETAQALQNKQKSLIDVVESLGEYINDEDNANRARAIEYLSQVIGSLPPTFLSRQQIQVLCQFLCDRIEDGGSIGGLKKLHGMERYNGELATMTFRAILAHFQDLQLRSQAQRLQVYDLLNAMMSSYRKALRSLGEEAIVGITDLVANEKDPRNLMVVFSILKVVMVEWDISAHAEVSPEIEQITQEGTDRLQTLFDSVFCYFPITFRPPPDDPYGITAHDLKDRLRACVAASGRFAPYAFPQLLDKLDSTSPNVKKDVLQTLTACATSYSLTTVSNYSVTLWDSIKYEILNVQEEDLAEEGLKVLQAIAIRLGQGLQSTDLKTPLAAYLRPITKECNEQLQEPQHKQAKPVGQILSAIGVASPVAFYHIVRSVLPPLSTLYQGADSIAKQRALLEVLVQLLDSAIAVYGSPTIPAPKTSIDNPLTPFKDRLFELNSQALMSTAIEEVSFRVVALRALLRLCLLQNYLQENEIGMVVQYLDDIALSEDPVGRDDLRKEAIQALVQISRIKSHLIMNITFPAFLARLPDSSPPNHRDHLITLEGLAQISVDNFVADTLVRRLLNRLDVVLATGGSHAYPQAILVTIHYVLARRSLEIDPNLQTYFEKIVVALVTRVAKAASGQAPVTALNEEATLEILGRLTTLIIRALGTHKQSSVALQCYSLFTPEGSFSPAPFHQTVPRPCRSLMIVSAAVLAGLPATVQLEHADKDGASLENLLAELVRLALAEDVPAVRQAILRQIGLLINKFMSSIEIPTAITMLFKFIAGIAESTAPTENAVRVVYWMSKALILRAVQIDEVLSRLLNLLTSSTSGASSARGFGLLLAPDEILSKENGATIRLLAKQKVFNICTPRIAQGFRAADSATVKANYLIALSGILKYMPTEVIMQEVDKLLPLLLQSIDLEDSDVKAATIQTLTFISTESPAAVETHVGSLVSRLLKASSNLAVNDASVRLNALVCLRGFPGRVKDSTLLPHRNNVIRSLMAVLDDPKRNVRKEAVECRAAWFNMDEPQSD